MNINKLYINFKINNINYNCKKDLVLIDALACNNIEIPRFCFNENLSIAGNCRMCLIELKNSVKPIASCAVNVMENMEIYTNTKLVKQAREHILEFLLINHPLDCPICDQGGECDLQDEVYTFGGDRGRFYEYKRAVLNMECSPIIKLILTRCIHCTRCVRFFEEVGGIPFFGMINRGHNMQISTYTKKNQIKFELSGNVIDLCPVGALTFKKSEFVGRAWEYDQGYTLDIFDTFLSSIRIDYKNNYKVIRILPNVNIENNWIHDKTRLFFDVLNYEKRYKDPYYLWLHKTYLKADWYYIIKYSVVCFIAEEIEKKLIVLGNFLDLNTLIHIKIFKHFTNSFLKSELEFNSKDLNFCKYLKIFSKKNNYIFSNLLKYIKLNILKNILIINCNIRYEIPLLNSKLRAYSLSNNDFYAYIYGNIQDVNLKHISLEKNIKDFYCFLEGKKWYCNKYINYYNYSSDKLEINQILFGISNISLKINGSIDYLNSFFNKKLNLWNYKTYTEINILQSNITLINSFFINMFNYSNNISFKTNTLKPTTVYHINTNIYNKNIRKDLNFFKKKYHRYRAFWGRINIFTYEFNKDNWPCTMYPYMPYNKHIYQGLYPELFFKKWYKKKINIIMPVKNLFEYNSITFKFNGQIKNFFKVFERNHFKTHLDILQSILSIYIPYSYDILRSYRRYAEHNAYKLKIYEKINNDTSKNYNINKFYAQLFNKNLKNVKLNIFLKKNKNSNFFYKIKDKLAYKNFFLINYFNKYYHNKDFITKFSDNILSSAKFFVKKTNF